MPSPNAFVATISGDSPVVKRRCVAARTPPDMPAWYGCAGMPAETRDSAVSSTALRVRA